MGILLLICVLIFVIYLIFGNTKSNKSNTKTFVKSITECNDIKDIINSIGYGRVNPYYTGMSIEDIKEIINKYEGLQKQKFANSIAMSQMMGFMLGISLPGPKCLNASELNVRMNKEEVVYAISIYVKNPQTIKKAYSYLNLKFGSPTSADGQFIIWRNQYMVINIDIENSSINVIDETLFKL